MKITIVNTIMCTLLSRYQTFTDEISSESCKCAYIEETIIKIRCCNPIEKTSIVSYFQLQNMLTCMHLKQLRNDWIYYGGLLRTILSKHIFMGKQILMAKNRTFSFSAHAFILSKHVTLWQTYFHGQSATFSWAKHKVFMDKPNCMPPLLATPEVGGARKERCSRALVTNYSSFLRFFPQQI